MSYSEPLVNQIKVFLLSVGVGVLLFFAYAAVQSFFRVFGEKKATVFLADILFSVIATLVSFFFMVFYNNGRVRLHLIFGEAVGYFAFYRCAGRYILRLLMDLAQKLNGAVGFALFPFIRVGRAFFNGINEMTTVFKVIKNKIKVKESEKEGSEEENGKKR